MNQIQKIGKIIKLLEDTIDLMERTSIEFEGPRESLLYTKRFALVQLQQVIEEYFNLDSCCNPVSPTDNHFNISDN